MTFKKKIHEKYKKSLTVFGNHGLTKYPIIRKLFNMMNYFVLSQLKESLIKINGQIMYLDKKDSLNLSFNRNYESVEIEIVKKEIKEGATVIDIGANIGYYTLIFAQLAGKNGKVFAFEPDPKNFQILKKNIEINGHKNVILEEKAISNKEGNLKLFLSKDNHGMHRIYPSKFCEASIDISSIKLDNYFKNNMKIDFIKIDIEGAEYDALKGMTSLIEKNKKLTILIEFAPASIEEFGGRPEEVLDFFIDKGFDIFCINNNDMMEERITKKQLLDKKGDSLTNLICRR